MKKQLLRILPALAIVLSVFVLGGCSNLPGDGGTSTITGKIYTELYNESNILYQEYYSPDEKVYIVYGDNIGYDDEVSTSYDGTYKFEFLRKGTYTIFVYSDCLGCPGSFETRMIEIEITDNNSVIELEDIIIEKR